MVRAAIVGIVVAVWAGGAVRAQDAPAPPLFASADRIELTLTADFSALEGDRRGETPERPATVTLRGPDGADVDIEAQLQTRGNFRRDRANCSFPPLRLNLKTGQTPGTVFEGEDKLKIVGSCRPNRDSYEQLVLTEYLAYRVYGLVSDESFRVRLARITYVDTAGKRDPFTRFAFFIEDDDALAARVGAEVFDLPDGKNLPPTAFDAVNATTVAIFQYMIGNTDWSDIAAHNTEILSRRGTALLVPYDFDFSGLVNAPYAIPDPDLRLRSVRERMYRGWCRVDLDVDRVLDRFRAARAPVEELFASFAHLSDGERERSLTFLRAFFDDIETFDRARLRFLRDCRVLR